MTSYSHSNTISEPVAFRDDSDTDDESNQSDPPYAAADEEQHSSSEMDDSNEEDIVPLEMETNSEGHNSGGGAQVEEGEQGDKEAPSIKDINQPPATKKRKYTYVKRIQKPHPKPNMRKKWKQDIEDLINRIEDLECCKKLACFKSCDASFLRRKMHSIRDMSYEGRRSSLSEMIGSSGAFYFDGKRVCNIFLKKAFCFSPDLISSVRHGTIMARQPPQSESFDPRGQSQTTSNSDRGTLQRDAIITCLERMAERCGDKMPDRDEIHLPYFRKRDVYSYFKEEFRLLHPPSIKCPSDSYFYSTWKKHCRMFKVRKLGRFAKCTTCEQLRKSISDSVAKRDYKSLAVYRRKKAEHNEMIARERREYKKKG